MDPGGRELAKAPVETDEHALSECAPEIDGTANPTDDQIQMRRSSVGSDAGCHVNEDSPVEVDNGSFPTESTPIKSDSGSFPTESALIKPGFASWEMGNLPEKVKPKCENTSMEGSPTLSENVLRNVQLGSSSTRVELNTTGVSAQVPPSTFGELRASQFSPSPKKAPNLLPKSPNTPKSKNPILTALLLEPMPPKPSTVIVSPATKTPSNVRNKSPPTPPKSSILEALLRRPASPRKLFNLEEFHNRNSPKISENKLKSNEESKPLNVSTDISPQNSPAKSTDTSPKLLERPISPIRQNKESPTESSGGRTMDISKPFEEFMRTLKNSSPKTGAEKIRPRIELMEELIEDHPDLVKRYALEVEKLYFKLHTKLIGRLKVERERILLEDGPGQGFQCRWKYCRERFPILESLWAHVEEHHLNRCHWGTCNQHLHTEHEFRSHVYQHISHVCHMCRKVFLNRDKLNDHWLQEHNVDLRLNLFFPLMEAKSKIRISTCVLCGETFKTSRDLICHVHCHRSLNEKDTPHRLKQVMYEKSVLRSQDKRGECFWRKCMQANLNKGRLHHVQDRHVEYRSCMWRVGGESNEAGNICTYVAPNRISFKMHVHKHVTIVRPSCFVCLMLFDDGDLYKRHVMTHTGIVRQYQSFAPEVLESQRDN